MERVMSELAWEISKKKHVELHLILYGIKREIFYKVPESLIIHQPGFIFNNRLRFWSTVKTLRYLRREVKNINPQSILSFGEFWNNFVMLSLIGTKYPIYLSDRCQPDKTLGRVHDFLRSFLYKRAAGIIAQTQMAKDIYVERFKFSNIKVIGNPIRQIPERTDLQKENIVLSVGRLIDSKHHDALIRLFSGIDFPDWRLIIVGGDALKQRNKDRLQELINSLGLENRVSLEGNQSEVDGYYLKSKIFAFTSSSEGFPNVIGEALSAGLPVVTFDCIAGPSDMVTDGENGFLIPLFDYETFSARLIQLMQDEELRHKMGKWAKESIKQFSVENISNQFYETITAASPENKSIEDTSN